MKKIFTIIFAISMLVLLAACEKDGVSSIAGSDMAESSSVQTESESQSSEESKIEDVSSQADTAQINSQVSSKVESTSSKNTECSHNYSAVTCTEAAKCTLCGVVSGNALGHSYSQGKCTRCGAIDANFATYKEGGKDSIIRTTMDGKSTALRIDISSANQRFTNISSFGKDASMNISYTKFLEVEGWLYFAQTINMKYTVNGSPYDVTIDEVYKIKTDGTNQTTIRTYQETSDKAIGVAEVFGFDGNDIYYVLENEDEGICEIYKATVSSNLTNLVSQGKKIASSPTQYAAISKCSLKDGYLYFTEKKTTYDPSISAAVTTILDSYKMKLDGTGLAKI